MRTKQKQELLERAPEDVVMCGIDKGYAQSGTSMDNCTVYRAEGGGVDKQELKNVVKLKTVQVNAHEDVAEQR